MKRILALCLLGIGLLTGCQYDPGYYDPGPTVIVHHHTVVHHYVHHVYRAPSYRRSYSYRRH